MSSFCSFCSAHFASPEGSWQNEQNEQLLLIQKRIFSFGSKEAAHFAHFATSLLGKQNEQSKMSKNCSFCFDF